MRCRAFAVVILGGMVLQGCNPDAAVVVGSKKFTESVVLGEIATQLINAAAPDSTRSARHWRELGGTRVLWEALRNGDIDAYPEYTGTLRAEIFADRELTTFEALADALREVGIGTTDPLGFENTYAIGMREARAADLGITRISDLIEHPALSFGLGNEFLDRADGWPGLRDAYRLPQANVTGLDHDLGYRALEAGNVDAMDLYSTDAEIAFYQLRVLDDDLHYFPEYQAVLLYRLDLDATVKEQLGGLGGALSTATMIELNRRAKIDSQPEAVLASSFLQDSLGVSTDQIQPPPGRWAELWRYTREHLTLVALSLGAAIAIGIPLGIFAARRPRLRQLILGCVGILQTIPSLALFVFLIPLLGIGAMPAMVALFLYSLLPIVRNTTTGLITISPSLIESAEALGLPSSARLRRIELPLAMPAILAGIKTAAVINVGTATLGALIGAGGYGQPILTGIRLADTSLILLGAIPAAGLALLVQGLFDLLERRLTRTP